jgi:eukaryotic-like serine/threonine-protein kinase
MGNLVGRSLAHFRIEAVLGEGGMGIVYRATDEKLRRQVALKVLPEAFQKDVDLRLRFLREARSAASVAHANVAAIHEVGEADGYAYIAMELIEGETLRKRMTKGVSVAGSLRIAKDIARGLGRAHEKGVVHRDLKPENVMITGREEVKILDFGLAKPKDDEAANVSSLGEADTEALLTEEGRVLGTPAYMSPEQARGEHVDARADVFSFGVLLFEMLTGERPFRGNTAIGMLLAASLDTPKRASELNPLVMEEVDRVVERCLEKKPEDRYANGQDLMEALDGILSGPHLSGSLLTPPPPPMPSLARGGRARARWGLLALLGVALAALVVGYRGRAWTAKPRSDATASGSGVPGPPGAITLLDQRPPATTLPEAAREYALGMGALHDDNTVAAVQHFERAAALDGTMAAAHLRAAIAHFQSDGSPERIRAEFARATELRSELSARDQGLLKALEPVLRRARPDPREAIQNVLALSKESPMDVELYDWVGWLCNSCPEVLPATEHAIALDPGDANAWQLRGLALAYSGQLDLAKKAFEQCTAVSLVTSDCLSSEAFTEMLAGRCADFESDARRTLDRSPSYGHIFLTSALVSTGQPEAAVREESGLLAGTLPEADRKLASLALDTQLALVAGDFARAQILADEEAAELMAHPRARTERTPHYLLTMQRLTAALETGDLAGASRIAKDFVERSGSWSAYASWNSGVDLSALIAHLAHLAPGDFEAARRERIDTWLAAGAERGLVWPYAFAAPASTPEEARAALEVMASYAPIRSYVASMWIQLGDVGIPDAAVGHAYLLAERPAEALPYLQRAVAACAQFDSPLTHTRAALELGLALEATGGTARDACAVYEVVLGRWGKARPRSVTADRARERSKALACAR